VRQLHQPIGDIAGVSGEPPVTDYFEEQIDKNGVHAHDGKEFQSPAMVADVDPPIA
jgi:hypothetical protein